jgi:hypothetical protein
LLAQSARQELIKAWEIERRLLASVDDYPALLKERNLGDLTSTEASCIVYDRLGDNCLGAIGLSERWKAHSLTKHRTEIERLAALGSGQAREWLGMAADAKVESLADVEIADRFFLGNVDVMRDLRRRYGRE